MYNKMKNRQNRPSPELAILHSGLILHPFFWCKKITLANNKQLLLNLW